MGRFCMTVCSQSTLFNPPSKVRHHQPQPLFVTSLDHLCPRLLLVLDSPQVPFLLGAPTLCQDDASPGSSQSWFFLISRITGYVILEKLDLTHQSKAVTTNSNFLSQIFSLFLMILYSSSQQIFIEHILCVPCSSVGKEPAYNAGDLGSIPEVGRSPGEGNGNPLKYSCLESAMDCSLPGSSIHGTTRVGHDLATKPLCVGYRYNESDTF